LALEIKEIANAYGKKKKFVRISRPGGVEPPDDLTDADGILEWLDDRKVIEDEWKRIKDLMSDASNLDVDARKEMDD